MSVFNPQYHVIFDDKSDTISTEIMTNEETDRICDDLFVTSYDCYVEEEYDQNDLLVYTPPPFDEPESHDCKARLEK